MLNKTIVLCLLLAKTFAEIIPLPLPGGPYRPKTSTIDPNDVVKSVKFLPLILGCKQVQVDTSDIDVGEHAKAYTLAKDLYPEYANYDVQGAKYVKYGSSKVYTFSVKGNSTSADLISTIQTNQAGVQKSYTEFKRVNLSEIYKDQKCSKALKDVAVAHWGKINPNPVVKAEQKNHTNGKSVFRFYFNNIKGYFQHEKSGSNPKITYVNDNALAAAVQANNAIQSLVTISHKIRVGDVARSNRWAATDSYDYYDRPYQTVSTAPKYTKIDDITKHKGYQALSDQFAHTLGKFDAKWILNVSSSAEKDTVYFKISINFPPLQVKQEYEAQYYGALHKAALLKVDEKTFTNKTNFSEWNQVKDFDSYVPFREADEYIQAQFTWLRFYRVSAAYVTPHHEGRLIRLAYSWNKKIQVDWTGNQINMVIYNVDGKYYLNKNDFSATNTMSAGRNDWVSLFVKTPDIPKYQYYGKIVDFFQNINPKFWQENQLQDIYIKDNLHVIILHNPTNDYNHTAALSIKDDSIQPLNQCQWLPLPSSNPLSDRLTNFVKAKYSPKTILFINFQVNITITHYQIGCLDSKDTYNSARVRYTPLNDAFEEEHVPVTSTQAPVPADVNASIVSLLSGPTYNVTVVVDIEKVDTETYKAHAIKGRSRWVYPLQWVNGEWRAGNSGPAADGFTLNFGFPSVEVSSCTGYVAKLHSAAFKNHLNYVSIESNRIGLDLYSRVIYSFEHPVTHKKWGAEAVVKSTYSLNYSHSIISWKNTAYLRDEDNYGYGRRGPYTPQTYGYDKKLFYQ